MQCCLKFLLLAVLLAAATASAADRLPPADQNLVLAAPIRSWDEAIPLGNGLTGGLLWGEKNLIRLSLDRGDLWDERPAAGPHWWKQRTWARGGDWDGPYNGATPTKLPAGRIEITLPKGVEVNRFELKLATAQGIARLSGGVSLDALFSAAEPIAVVRIPGAEPQAIDLIPAGASKQAGDAGPQQRRRREATRIPCGNARTTGPRRLVRPGGRGRTQVLCMHGDPAIRQRDPAGRGRHVEPRHRGPACAGPQALLPCPEPRLRSDAPAPRSLVAGILVAVVGASAGA